VALQPVHAWLAARLGGSRRLAAVILTLVLLAIIINSGRPHGKWVDRSIPPVAHKLALSPTCALEATAERKCLGASDECRLKPAYSLGACVRTLLPA
jgi:hypothetical protein